jgi:hypothetical protein
VLHKTYIGKQTNVVRSGARQMAQPMGTVTGTPMATPMVTQKSKCSTSIYNSTSITVSLYVLVNYCRAASQLWVWVPVWDLGGAVNLILYLCTALSWEACILALPLPLLCHGTGIWHPWHSKCTIPFTVFIIRPIYIY